MSNKCTTFPGAKVRVITREARYFYTIISRAHVARAVA